MTYSVKEIFYTLQGEGAQSGRPAVFCRFSGCNLWSGREEDRAGAACGFCDTDFVGTDGDGGGKFETADALADAIEALWPADAALGRFVVCTGGEPLLQLDPALIDALHRRRFEIAVETNGTQQVPDFVNWVCVSPKGGEPVVVSEGDEIKLVYPQPEPAAQPDRFAGLAFDHFFLQPLDGPDRAANTQACIDYCKAHPQWRLSLQTHKILGIP